MKQQNDKGKLAFNKAIITELNHNSLEKIYGGTSALSCSFCIASSNGPATMDKYFENFVKLN